jgi:acyl-CoA dehydrogenase
MFKEEHKIFRQGLRDFLDREVMPNIDQWEEEQRMPKDLWPKFGEMGYFGLNYSEKYGGMDADFMYSVIFMEEISKCESGWIHDFACRAAIHVFALHLQARFGVS